MARRLTLREGLREGQVGAWRHWGRRHPVLFAFGPYMVQALGVLLVVAGLTVAWVRTPHLVLGWVALTMGAAPLLVFAVNRVAHAFSGAGLRKRLMARASGVSRPAVNLRLAVLTGAFSAVMFTTAWLAMGSQWA